MSIDGFNINTILSIVSEIGLNPERLKDKFPSAKHFASWLSLAPNKRITGGKVLSSRTNRNKNPLAHAFRQAANAVGNQKDTPMAHFFRRLAFRHGRKVAITATARKLAVTFYKMVTNGQDYSPIALEEYQQQLRIQKIKRIQKSIHRMEIKIDEVNFDF